VGFDLTRPLYLGAGAVALAAIVLVWWRFAPPLSPTRARVSLGLRVLIVVLLTCALAGFQLQTTPGAQSLIVVADLSASTQSAVDLETSAVQRILAQRRGDDRAGVLSFGRDPQVEVTVSDDPRFLEFQSRPNRNYTDLAAALQLAASILPTDTRRHIVVVSDGQTNLGDAVAEARLLNAEGVRVDTVALQVPIGAEAYVAELRAPSAVNQGGSATADAVIISNSVTTATVRWYVDNALVSAAQVTLAVGETTISRAVKPDKPGFHSVRAVIDPVRDTYAENNVGEALVQVIGPPRVLVIEQKLGSAASLEAALRSTGILATTMTPDKLPRSAAELAAYQSVILVNIPASSLGTDGMALLQAVTRDLGTGLVVIGGSESYGPGGYAGTAMETALPVQIEIPQTMQKPPVAVMLVLESSETPQGDQVVRGAAEAVVDALTARDSVGVSNGFEGQIVVPLGPLTDKAKVKKAIESMQLGDPPSYVPDLNVAAEQLLKTKSTLKHIILLGDGDATARPNAPAAAAIYEKGITVSTVAVNAIPSDVPVMQQIAAAGHGRFYLSSSVNDVPAIFLKETNEALKPWIVEGTITPRLASLLDVLPGVHTESFPSLTGYVATTPKAAADIVLKSPQGDPLLATWRYGLGRVMAWTSDAQGRWTADMLRWPDSNRFFGDIVRSSLPQAGDPALQAEMQVQGDHTHLLVTTPSLTGASVTLSAVTPDLTDRQLTLALTGPGRFEGDLPTAEVGGYLLHISESAGGVVRHTNTFGLVVPYSPEYRELGTDRNNLRAVASAGGGTLLEDPAQVFTLPVPATHAALALSELLLVLAILLFPIDIALRRLVLQVEDIPAWKAAFKPAPAKPIPAEATVSQLKERVVGVRATRAAKTARRSDPTSEGGTAPPDDTIEKLRTRRGR
jgi:uncharacterized membrane protein/Mg-chelatase subunit ChlD